MWFNTWTVIEHEALHAWRLLVQSGGGVDDDYMNTL